MLGEAGGRVSERGVLLLEGGQHAGRGRAQRRELQGRQRAGMLLQAQDVLDGEGRRGRGAGEHRRRGSGRRQASLLQAPPGASRARPLLRGRIASSAQRSARPRLLHWRQVGRQGGKGAGGGTLPRGPSLIGQPGRRGPRDAALLAHLI